MALVEVPRAAPASAGVPPLGLPTRIAYALGGIPVLLEQRGLSVFLMIFYNQVVGLPAYLVALALLIASFFDVICDLIVGQISDNLRSAWGRRHPFIYASLVPLPIAYFFLWMPPAGWSQNMLFVYLLVILLIIRLADSCFELPSNALLPELTDNYDERTSIVTTRTLASLLTAMLLTMVAYRVFLREDGHGGGGILAREGYFAYGLTASLLIGAGILISGLGTHWRIPFLSQPRRRFPTIAVMLRESRSAVKNKSFIMLILCGILMSVANGAKSALELYFNLYFWGLTQAQLAVLVGASVVGIIVGGGLVSPLARALGKRAAAAVMVVAGIIGNGGPVLARLLGVIPPNHTAALFIVLFIDIAFTFAVATATTILISSMMNDVVEDVAVKTGRRSEGLLMAADNLSRKFVSSLGIFISGLTLTLIGFPRTTTRTSVPEHIIYKLSYGYIPITMLFIVALIALSFYGIDRHIHEQNLRILAKRAGEASAASEETEVRPSR
jgi:Na+/melibiose symporter-like transporter